MQNTVAIVIVTYGDRHRYLRQVLEAIAAQSVNDRIKRVIVSDNGASLATKSFLKDMRDNRMLQVVDLGGNQGSGEGYASGIRLAMTSGVNLVWCLDDDNIPATDALERLLEAREALPRPACLVSLRADREAYVMRASGLAEEDCFGRSYSFHGFSVVDLPRKIVRRLGNERSRSIVESREAMQLNADPVRVPYAPYGGFMFELEMIERVGLPRGDYYLGEDDHEFAVRSTMQGYPIYLVPKSVIHDAEVSWGIGTTRTARVLGGALTSRHADASRRQYYGARNRTHLEYSILRWGESWIYWINMAVYMILFSVVAGVATCTGHPFAPKVLLATIRGTVDGVKGRLGRSNVY